MKNVKKVSEAPKVEVEKKVVVEEPIAVEEPVIKKEEKKKVVKQVAIKQLNVRKAPGGEPIDVIYDGAEVEILEEVDGWSHIGAERWVRSIYLK